MNITRRGLIAGAALLGLVGCSQKPEQAGSVGAQSTGTAADVANAGEPKPLEIVESGYSVGESGYVHYGIALKNPNEGYEAQYPAFTITGKAGDGSIVFSDEQTTMVIFAGETTYYGFQAGNGSAPATVEFTVKEPTWVESSPIGMEVFSVSNINEISGDYGMTSFTGEVTSNTPIDSDMFSQMAVTVVTRDASGVINFGSSSFFDIPLEGQTSPFELSGYEVPEHSSFEVYAQLWW